MPRTKTPEAELAGLYYSVYPGKLDIPKKEDFTPFVESPKLDLFHIGQCYENEPVNTIECKVCGGSQFNVGIGSYYTAIRCVNCEWETCIHDG